MPTPHPIRDPWSNVSRLSGRVGLGLADGRSHGLSPVRRRRSGAPAGDTGYEWEFWLRANEIAQANGTAVQDWDDLGRGNTNATNTLTGTTLATGQLNGKSAVRFPGTESMFSARTGSQKPLTTVVVAKFDGVTSFQTMVGPSGGSGGRLFRLSNTGKLELVKSNVALIGTSTTALSANTYYILTVTYDSSGNFAFYVNGAAAGSGTNDLEFDPQETRLGTWDGGLEWLTGYIAEVREANVVLTSAELAAVHSDLGAFYGIAV